MLDSQSGATRLATLKQYGPLDTPAEAAFGVIVQDAATVTNSPIATISLVDEGRQWLKAAIGVDHREDPIDESTCAHAIRSDELFTVADASLDARFRNIPAGAKERGNRFYAGAPRRMRSGARLGTLRVIDIAPRDDLDAEERAAPEILARRTVAAVELRRHIGDAQDWLEESADLRARRASRTRHCDGRCVAGGRGLSPRQMPRYRRYPSWRGTQRRGNPEPHARASIASLRPQ